MESDPDWNKCIDNNGSEMARCVRACDSDESCELNCLTQFKSKQLNCPCEVSRASNDHIQNFLLL